MRDFTAVQRVVIKVGTNVLTGPQGVDTDFLRIIARQIAALVQEGRQVILVTSGAIGMGAQALGITTRVKEVRLRQALAAVGQGVLMHEYQEAFRAYGQKVAQVLLTNRIMSHRRYYLNLKNAFEQLLSMHIVPIVNENDCVSIDEIGLAFGDNDRLSALVASKIDAELLVLLTDVAGLYDQDPRRAPDASLLTLVPEITPEIESMAASAGSTFGTGGMISKIAAIKIAAQAGCKVVLAHGREANVIRRTLAGDEVGTLFLPRRRLSNRKRWILNSHAQGTIVIDDGAAAAVRRRKSLLAVGVTDVSGAFETGDVVEVGGVAKGVARLGAAALRQLLAARRAGQTDAAKSQIVVHGNDLVVFDV